MKIETINKLYESAIESAKAEKEFHDEVEVVFVPIVIGKINGKIGTIKGVNTDIIFKNEK